MTMHEKAIAAYLAGDLASVRAVYAQAGHKVDRLPSDDSVPGSERTVVKLSK